MYFHNCRKMYRISGDTEVLERMSPMLRGVVALEAHRPWLRRVWYLDPQVQYEEGSSLASELWSEQEAFVAKLACALVHCSFSSEERIPVGSLYILRKGLCSRGWKFLGPGRVWGEDLILNYPQLIETTPTVALTYVEVAATSIASILTTFPATATLSSTALAASAHRHLRYHHRHLSSPCLTAGAPTRPSRHDGRGVDAPRRGGADQARRRARLPSNAQPCPCDAPSMLAPAHACCAYYCPWQLRIALARFLLKHLRKAKKSREARWKVKQMDLWKNRQVAQITTASTRSRGGGFNAEAMRSLVRDELRQGVDDALKRAMPGLAKMVVAEQKREAEKAPRRGRASSDSAFMMSRSGRSTSQSLLADLKGLWA